MQKITRSWLPAILAIALCTVLSWAMAQDKMSENAMTKASPQEMKMAGEHMDKMKMMAAEHPQEMASDMARLIVMDQMAVRMAMDPAFTQMLQQSMSDPKVKKAHEDARKMAQDPAQMAKIKQQIMEDPKAMAVVIHRAAGLAMMHDSMMHDGMMKDDKMKGMQGEKK